MDKEDKDCIWKYDIEALEIAIETLERELKTIGGNSDVESMEEMESPF